jgi:glucose/arabinose dehydrogenase
MKAILFLGVLLASFMLGAQTISIQEFASGFNNPVDIAHAGDSRLFIVEQGGAIKIVNANGAINSTPFLTLSTSVIATGGERGLLGLAFHPNYATNGYFYVNYTRASDGDTVIARYSVNESNPNVANPNSAQIILIVDQPASNHNGGCLRFGPDGYLYIGMGDGGGAGDTNNYAQNINNLLGKMLRINVDSGSPYSNPSDNPFVGVAGADEIWAVGLRNPWKFSFNRLNGDLWIADVGQYEIEEINKVSSTASGLNYGWRCYEGNSVFNGSGCPSISTFTMPFAQYTHSGTSGCSITGGYAYTGSLYPSFQGKYFFSDYCLNKIGTVDSATGAITFTTNFTGGSNSFTTFGEDVNGELYIAGTSQDKVYKIIDPNMGTADFVKNGLSLYPNPAQGEFYLKNTNQIELENIKVFDLTGKMLLQNTIGNQENTIITTTNLQQGLYLVTVEDKQGNQFSTKLLLN